MSCELLSTIEAARRLAISRATLYDWLRQSDASTFEIRGQPTSIAYFQGGRRGQGRIKIAAEEIERLLSLMKVSPKPVSLRICPTKTQEFQHITVKLGRPED